MSHKRAITFLRKADPKLAAVMDEVGPCTFEPAEHLAHFTAITRSIVFQQLSGKAASTIYGRFSALFDDDTPVAHKLIDLSDDQLRAVGLSRQKIGYLRDLATRVHTGDVPIDKLDELPDDEMFTKFVVIMVAPAPLVLSAPRFSISR